jgi:hypothetical protein
MDNDTYMQRMHLLLQDLNEYPAMLNGVLDETTRQQTIADMGDIMTQLAQVDDGESLLAVVQRLDTMLQERGIMAVLTDRPPGAIRDRLTPEEKQQVLKNMQDSAWVARQKELWENTTVQVEAVFKTTLPKQPEQPEQPA